ncbi:sigma-70 family RNA polymerase sigma factor [Streptomyces sp. SID3343]|uniref:sigma-70 family RNA polymerase sigma factor n=1 Tax=Streptomyces sp. SID3343 TaxID=2690260 RepID=UPI00192870C1
MLGSARDERDAALATLLAARGDALKGYAFLLCGDAAQAEDLVQEALLRALDKLVSTKTENLEPLVRRTILRLVVDGSQRRRRWLRVRPLFVPPPITDDESADAAERITVRAALMRLSPRRRACVILRYYEDRSVAQIALDLDCGEGTVKRHLHDARRVLAAALTDDASLSAPSPERVRHATR